MRYFTKFAHAFPALQNKNYRLYFSGQLISLIGTWLKLTHSAFLIGLVTALSSLPSLFFTLFGGVLVDIYSKKRILLFTQIGAMVLAMVLGILAISNVVKVWEIAVIAFLLGTVNSIDSPARQAFVSEIVTREQLPSAIALNSGVFNAARVIGPGFAGLFIALFGIGGAFILNSLSYLAVISALSMMDFSQNVERKSIQTLSAIKEGVLYALRHPIIGVLLLFTGVSSVFGWSYSTVMPLIAHNTFHLEAAGLGYLYAASGLGSLLGALLLGTLSKRISPLVFIFGGNAVFAISITAFTLTDDLHVALPLLFLCGLGLLSQFAMMNTIIQSLVKSELRGRVMSIYILMFVGMTPLGNFLVGLLSEKMGTGFAIRTGAAVVFLFGLVVLSFKNRIQYSYEAYKKQIPV
jgi:MFS family permease